MSKNAFGNWTLTKLDKRFGLTQVGEHPALDMWLQSKAVVQVIPSDYEQVTLTRLRERATRSVDIWNEQEYALNFIGPLLALVDFSHPLFNAFAERDLKGIVDGEELSGKPDGMIASGRREPEVPYFCLQEYKRERDPDGDPAGQCLAAMLVAQELNQHEWPVYGCYVLGRNWFFMILQGQEYAISNSYTVTQAQIVEIFQILVGLKQIIIEIVTDRGTKESNAGSN